MNQSQYLTDEQWAKIDPIISQKLGTWGSGNANDNRTFVNACLYILRTKSPWYQLPSKYGKYKGVNRRYNRWRNQHIWDDILVILLSEPGYEWLMVQQTNKKRIPTFTMTWLSMVSPSKPLLNQVQKQMKNKLDCFKKKLM